MNIEKDYIHFSEMLKLAERGEHDFVFVAKGTKSTAGGYKVSARAKVTSTFHEGTMNILIPESGQVRKIWKVLVIKFDGKKVIL